MIEENAMALATVDADGNPNNIAIAYVKVISDTELLITDGVMTQTKENVLDDPRVCLVVWKGWSGYKLVGTAEYYTEGEYFEMVKKHNAEVDPDIHAKGAIKIEISKIIPLKE